MLFDAKQFELYFKESTLKKGLKLFEKELLEFVEKLSPSEFHFLANNEVVVITKKGDKVFSYTCSCNKNIYCEHFSAALFYFQKDALGLSSEKKEKKSNKDGASKISKAGRRKTELIALFDFIEQHKTDFSKKSISDFFNNKHEITLYDFYTVKIQVLSKSYIDKGKLDQLSIDKLYQTILQLTARARLKETEDNANFFLTLALVNEFNTLFNLRFTGDESALKTIYQEAIATLDEYYVNGLSENEIDAWFAATIQSLQNKNSLYSESFFFFVPRFICISKSNERFEQIRLLLNKRKYKIHYSKRFDKLLIVVMQLGIREEEIFKIPFVSKHYQASVELTIAKADLCFIKGKASKAFNILEAGYEEIKNKQRYYYNDYLEYILEKAQLKKESTHELKYLRESFFYGLHISPLYLKRFIELETPEDLEKSIREILTQLKSDFLHYPFEKIVMLLLEINALDELVAEIKKQSNKFNLLHQVAIKKLPEYNTDILSLYLKHLMQAFDESSVWKYQEQLMETSKTYLDQLPEPVRNEMVERILDRLGGKTRIYRYIKNLFGLALLDEED